MVITEVADSWAWRPNVEDGFTVKSLYVYLQRSLLPQNVLLQSAQIAFKNIQKSVVPSKVSALTWQLLLGRIPNTS
jgi:hypothetical protein